MSSASSSSDDDVAASSSEANAAAPTTVKRRSQPTTVSSLDYKPPPQRSGVADKPLTTKPGKKRTGPGEYPQQQQVPRDDYRHAPRTRARGSSGPPPHRYDYDPQAAMRKALYEEKESSSSSSSSPTSTKNSSSSKKASSTTKYRRNADGSMEAVPKHVQEMMEDGVPVGQWLILLGLVLVGLIQLVGIPTLRKNKSKQAQRQNSSSGNSSPKKTTSGKNQKKDTKRMTAKPTSSKKTTSSFNKHVEPKKAAQKAENAAPKEVSKPQPKPAPIMQTDMTGKQQQGQQKKKKATKKPKTQISNNDSQSGPKVAEKLASANNSGKTMPTSVVSNDESDIVDDGDWQPVIKGKKITKPSVPNEPAAKSKGNSTVATAATSSSPTQAVTSTTASTVSKGGNNSGTAKSKKNKKKNNKGVQKVSASTEEADAELARKLQEQEEALAAASPSGADLQEADTWQEVTVRKKK